MNLENKTAIVTGGSRGIGRAICIALAKEGANIVTCYAKGAAAAEETVAMCKEYGVQAVAIQADVAVKEEVDNLFAEALKITGTVEILVNNAGITRDGLLMRMSDDDFNQVIDTNLRGAFYCMRAASKLMMKKRYGRIVTISSVVGVMGNAGQVSGANIRFGDVLAVKRDRAALDRHDTGQAVDGLGLTVSVNAGDADDLTPADGEADVINDVVL